MGAKAVGLTLALAALSAMWAQRFTDPLVRAGMDHFYNLEYADALAKFKAAVEEAPDDPERHNLVAQVTLFNLMLRSGALETQMVTGNNPFLRSPKMEPTVAEQKDFTGNIDAAIQICQARLNQNPKDEDALYALGVALGLRGNYNFLVQREWMDALRDLTAARKHHNQVLEMNPARVDARLLQGIHDYIVGSLPFTYRMLGFLAGFKGSKEDGIRTLQLVAEKGERNRIDAKILLGVAYRREKRPQDVIPIIQELSQRYPRNYLFLLELSQMYSDLGEKENALGALDRLEKLKKAGAAGFRRLPQERIDFARGNLLFWYDDLDGAYTSLKRASQGIGRLDMNSGVLTWMRLGQVNDLQGRREEAKAAYQEAIRFAPNSEQAKESKRYLRSPYQRERG